MVATILCLAGTLGAGGCSLPGSDGDDETQKVSNAQIPFTFELPKDFRQRRLSPGSSKGQPPIVAYGIDTLNLIDVRKSLGRELALDSIDTQIKASLSQLGIASRQSRRERHSDVNMVVFDIDNKVKGKPTNSKLYFFAGGGGTWELECQSSGDNADNLSSACDKALDTIEFTKK
jgi:hypothetical protein